MGYFSCLCVKLFIRYKFPIFFNSNKNTALPALGIIFATQKNARSCLFAISPTTSLFTTGCITSICKASAYCKSAARVLAESGYSLKIASSTSSRMPFLLASIPATVLSASGARIRRKILPNHIVHRQFGVMNFRHLLVGFVQIIKMKHADNHQNNINNSYRRQKYKKIFNAFFIFDIVFIFV